MALLASTSELYLGGVCARTAEITGVCDPALTPCAKTSAARLITRM